MIARFRLTTRWRLYFAIATVTVLSVLVSACASPLGIANTETPNTYLLQWSGATAAAPDNPKGPSLLIGTPVSNPGFGSSQMVYIEEPFRLNAFVRHQWADAPARMLEPLLLVAAEQTGLFRAVTAFGARVPSYLRLDTHLLHLQQVFRDDSSEIQLALRVSLVELAPSRLLATGVFEVRKPAMERTPYAGVLAANQAVAELMVQLQDFLIEHLCADRSVCR